MREQHNQNPTLREVAEWMHDMDFEFENGAFAVTYNAEHIALCGVKTATYMYRKLVHEKKDETNKHYPRGSNR